MTFLIPSILSSPPSGVSVATATGIAPICGLQPADRFGFETGPNARYAGLFAQIARTGQFSGEWNGFRYVGRSPHYLRGSHQAEVRILEIEAPEGARFSCVMRDCLEDAENYEALSRRHPEIRDLLARIYGFMDQWVVMEKLEGLELYEIRKRLEETPDLIPAYASAVLDVLEVTSQAGLRLCDVGFIGGVNVMFDPQTVRIRLIEHNSPQPEGSLEPVALMSHKIIEQLTACECCLGEEVCRRYAFELLRQAFLRRPAKEYRLLGEALPSFPWVSESLKSEASSAPRPEGPDRTLISHS